jgi:signal transduction histidine kinase
MTSPLGTSPLLNLPAIQLARLVEISILLNSTQDPDKLLQSIILSAAEMLDCEAASIMLYDEKRGELFFVTATGSEAQQLTQIPVPLEGSIAGTIFRENRPLIINNVASEPRHYNQVAQQVNFHPQSLLGVPMRIKTRVTGVLEALNKRSGAFSPTDSRLLSILASQAAVAIHNARLMQAIQKAYNELKQVDKLKSDFMSIASHELRTPLGIILGYATLLKEDAQGELSEHAETVLNSAIRLRALVEDMTNMNLLQVGTSRLELKPIPIQHVLQVSCDEIARTAEARGHKLVREFPVRPLMVNGEMEKLTQVFVNLLSNAVRFTPDQGMITVRLIPGKKEVTAEVTDTGIGIAASELDKIFTEFYQIEDHLVRREGGLGLGLSIAQGVVKQHNGHIWAESKGLGKGATFKVVLPLTEN